jgi:hypothetical protein
VFGATAAHAGEKPKRALANPFFVFNNGVKDATFDTYALLETLVDLGFEGPVGLQCYNVPGDKADILAQSMAAWRGYEDRMAR